MELILALVTAFGIVPALIATVMIGGEELAVWLYR